MRYVRSTLVFVVTLMVLMGLAACGARPSDDESQAQATTETTAQGDGAADSSAQEEATGAESSSFEFVIDDGSASSSDGSASSDDDSASSDDESSHEDEFWDRMSGEWVRYDDIVHIYEMCDVEEYDDYYGKSDFPTDVSGEFDGDVTVAKGEIDDPDVAGDLWERVVRMRLRPSGAQPNEGETEGQSVTFYWKDGHSQTYTFVRGSGIYYSLIYGDTIYPIFEHELSGGDVFNGPVVTPDYNSYYPGLVLDVIPRLAGKAKGAKPLTIVKNKDTDNVSYEDEMFWWDANSDGVPETVAIKEEASTSDSVGGIRIKLSWVSDCSCLIEGATYLRKIELSKDDDNSQAEITYETKDSDEPKRCTVTYVDGAFEVTYP